MQHRIRWAAVAAAPLALVLASCAAPAESEETVDAASMNYAALSHEELVELATEEGEGLRREADALEKARKAEWDAKEVLVENYLEFQLAKAKRDRLEQGLADEVVDGLDAAEHDILPSRKLSMAPRDGKLPWWRDEEWAKKLAGALDGGLDVVRTKEPVL